MKKLTVLIVFLVANVCFGLGHRTGNGGDVITCFSSDQIRNLVADKIKELKNNGNTDVAVDPLSNIKIEDIKTVTLLDLHNIDQSRLVNDMHKPYLKILDEKISGFINIKNHFYNDLLYLKDNFVPGNPNWERINTGLIPIDDSVHDITFKSNCLLLQIASQSRVGKLIRVKYDTRLFNKMNEVNKAALIFHEWMYSLFPEAKDSKQVRDIVAKLFNKNTDEISSDTYKQILSFFPEWKINTPGQLVLRYLYGGNSENKHNLTKLNIPGVNANLYGYIDERGNYFAKTPFNITIGNNKVTYILKDQQSANPYVELVMKRDSNGNKKIPVELTSIYKDDGEVIVLWSRDSYTQKINLRCDQSKADVYTFCNCHNNGFPSSALFQNNKLEEIFPKVYATNNFYNSFQTGIDFYENGNVKNFFLAGDSIYQNIELMGGTSVELYDNNKIKKATITNETSLNGFSFVPRQEIEFYPNGNIQSGNVVDDFEFKKMKFAGMNIVSFHENGKIASGKLLESYTLAKWGWTLLEDSQVFFDDKNNLISAAIKGDGQYNGVPISNKYFVDFWNDDTIRSVVFNKIFKPENGIKCKGTTSFYKNGKLFYCTLEAKSVHQSGNTIDQFVTLYTDGSLMQTIVSEDKINNLDLKIGSEVGFYKNHRLAYATIDGDNYHLWNNIKFTGPTTFYDNGNIFSGIIYNHNESVKVYNLNIKDNRIYFHKNGQLKYAVSAKDQKYKGKWFFEGDEIWLDASGTPSKPLEITDEEFMKIDIEYYPENEWKKVLDEKRKFFMQNGYL
ncbi:MAG: hypothetical protein A2381_11665 [Bdellovibrionales bacterium RIFOXYB1_FULL_37_110]|nr:MAG: hypothetical protein A2417_11970 [Bdellovibrionales bacterium RIFOXYC1_FULL_37_79]OFZ57346.1 MAG: hypothetical protein A2381_11665 [Bdellovibrionales bacterium RIFOXYB1_FULL_37_110]OFZ62242.1 MAG: hypothetical protein A2577_14215 [Bdellovibrionales bacterium RIFOXYD1_FULL_36_51]